MVEKRRRRRARGDNELVQLTLLHPTLGHVLAVAPPLELQVGNPRGVGVVVDHNQGPQARPCRSTGSNPRRPQELPAASLAVPRERGIHRRFQRLQGQWAPWKAAAASAHCRRCGCARGLCNTWPSHCVSGRSSACRMRLQRPRVRLKGCGVAV